MRLSYLFDFIFDLNEYVKTCNLFLADEKYFFEGFCGQKRYFYCRIDFNSSKFICNWDFILHHTVCFSICCIVCCSIDVYFSTNSNCHRHLWIRKSLFTRVLVFGDFIVYNVAFKFASDFSVFTIKRKKYQVFFSLKMLETLWHSYRLSRCLILPQNV